MPRATDPRIARSLRVAATKTTARTNEAQREREQHGLVLPSCTLLLILKVILNDLLKFLQ